MKIQQPGVPEALGRVNAVEERGTVEEDRTLTCTRGAYLLPRHVSVLDRHTLGGGTSGLEVRGPPASVAILTGSACLGGLASSLPISAPHSSRLTCIRHIEISPLQLLLVVLLRCHAPSSGFTLA